MKVGIGTKNPLKIKVIEEAFTKVFKEVEFTPLETDSEVPDEPKEAEILKGALNRARNSLMENDFGVGMESGIVKVENRTFAIGYCVIIDKEGKYTIGSQPMFELPRIFSERIDKGEDLGKITDDIFKAKNIKHSVGAVGMISNNLLTREDLIRAAVFTALIPLVGKKIYSD